MKKILTREAFEYIKQQRSDGVLAVELEEELGYSANTILNFVDKSPTWEDYEAKKKRSREWWHSHPEAQEKRKIWRKGYREREEQLRRKRRLINLEEIKAKERERYHRRLQDPEYAAKEKIRGAENWRRWIEKKKKEEEE